MVRIAASPRQARQCRLLSSLLYPGGRIATVIEKRGRGWLFVELDGDANDEGGAFERKCIRQRASPTNDITRASSPTLQGEPDGSVVTPPPKN